MKKKLLITIIGVILLIIVASIGFLAYALLRDFSVNIYISNQSYADASTNITIKVNGNIIFNNQCWVEDQHNWTTISIKLSPGIHKFDAIEKDHNIKGSREFLIIEEDSIVINYWYSPEEHNTTGSRHFSITIYPDQEVFFD